MLFWLRMRFKETMMQIDRPRVVNTAAADEAELLSSSLFRGRFILTRINMFHNRFCPAASRRFGFRPKNCTGLIILDCVLESCFFTLILSIVYILPSPWPEKVASRCSGQLHNTDILQPNEICNCFEQKKIKDINGF